MESSASVLFVSHSTRSQWLVTWKMAAQFTPLPGFWPCIESTCATWRPLSWRCPVTSRSTFALATFLRFVCLVVPHLTFSMPSDVYVRWKKSFWFAPWRIYTSASFTEFSCFYFKRRIFHCAPVGKLDMSCVHIHEGEHRATLLLADPGWYTSVENNKVASMADDEAWSQRCEKEVSCKRFQCWRSYKVDGRWKI